VRVPILKWSPLCSRPINSDDSPPCKTRDRRFVFACCLLCILAIPNVRRRPGTGICCSGSDGAMGRHKYRNVCISTGCSFWLSWCDWIGAPFLGMRKMDWRTFTFAASFVLLLTSILRVVLAYGVKAAGQRKSRSLLLLCRRAVFRDIHLFRWPPAQNGIPLVFGVGPVGDDCGLPLDHYWCRRERFTMGRDLWWSLRPSAELRGSDVHSDGIPAFT
jgi:hypothetical protein